MPTPDEFVRALRNERAYAGDHPILGRAPVTAPPVLGPAEAWRALGSPDPLNLGPTLHSANPMEAAQNTVQGLMNMVGPIPAKAAAGLGVAALPALVRYGSNIGAAAEHAAAPFYSAAERAIGEAGLTKAPLNQWLATLRNKGVKEEELNWLGLGRAPIGDTPGWAGHVTKDQLNDWIKGHGVQLQEVQKGTKIDSNKLEQSAQDHYGRSYQDLDVDHQHSLRVSLGDTGNTGVTKFQQYQLPGGTNYRETLLTLPNRNEAPSEELKQQASDIIKKAGTGVRHWGVNIDNLGSGWDPRQSSNRWLKENMITPEDHVTFNKYLDQKSKFKGTGQNAPFTSSHWDEPNVLAHVRHNDRILPPNEAGGDPRKALFLEEVQSDWHQKGRNQGYRGVNDDQKMFLGVPRSEVAGHEGVPDAPFKQSWPDLALKRMLAKAAHEGYDALAWTPGDVQAARYDLSKQVQAVHAYPNADGTFNLNALPKGARGDYDIIEVGKNIPKEKLADHVGKDLAEKIAAQTEGAKSYEGGDLKVGGEGMKAFYDKMLVDKANALGKRYGAKVTQESLDVRPNEHYVGGNRPGEFTVYTEREGEEVPVSQYHSSREDAQQYADKLNAGNGKAYVLPITPELRAAAQKGFPLFATGGVAAMGAAQPGEQEPAAKPHIDITPNPTNDENQRMLDALRGQPGEL